ncbi:hypothetical protein Tco_0061156 [Tanacetum coccineum]
MGFIVSTYDEYFKPLPNVDHPVPEVPTPVPAASTRSPSSTTVDQDAPSTSTSQTISEQQSSNLVLKKQLYKGHSIKFASS